ncbi:hypothetical protein QZH41_012680 [Actinostola sp. cb2023]|nr:hypothetical protein QZH41_012680 [Actinostola sp. cb2023]
MKRKIEESGVSQEEGSLKKPALEGEAFQSSKNASLYKPPTSEEMNSLKETENLFKSSLFRMQITELLSEVKPKKKTNKALDATLHDLNTFLKSLPRGKEHELCDQSWLSKKVKFPLPSPPSDVKGKFHFIKPSSINVVGSYVLGTLTKPDFCVDVIMEMPQECFQPKDYLNMRYHHKRAFYLAVVASKLIKSKTFASVKFSHFNGELLKPILLLKPKGKAGKNYTIKLYPVLPKDFFKLHRFSPNVNNIRPSWFKGYAVNTEQQDVGPATPHYNSSILSDALMENHLHYLYKTINSCESVQDAVILINVWLQQRELSKGRGSFGSFLVAMVISHLFTSRKINIHMSSYQILRVFLQFIATTNWTENGIEVKKDQNSNENTVHPSLSDFHSAFDVVFIDPSGYLNLCANLSKDLYLRVRHEAKLAIEFLDSRFIDGFEVLFMKKVPFLQTFDQFVCLSQISVLHDIIKKPELQNKELSRAGDWVPVVSDWMMDLLREGLGKRIELLSIEPWTPKEWSTKECPPSLPCDDMVVGLMLDPDHCDQVLDPGPPADDPKASKFRAFWGGKSELRRFQDGSILEAVVWPCSNAAEKRLICAQVIKHLLERHCKVDPSLVHFISNQLDGILQPTTPDDHARTKARCPSSTSTPSMGTGEEEMQQVMKSYDALCQQIRALELPLGVHSLQGISPVFRGSEVHPPTPCFRNAFKKKQMQDDDDKENGYLVSTATNVSLPSITKSSQWCPVAEVLLQFETSGKWPDDLVAIQHIKAAFHIKLAELLADKCSLQAVATPKHVDVLKSGFAFRVKIAHYREMVLLQQSKPSEELEEKTIKEKLAEMEREIVHLPVLTTTLHGVEQQYSAYSGTVRLAKRWVSAHLLSNDIPSECLELLVAYLFITPAPYKPPSYDDYDDIDDDGGGDGGHPLLVFFVFFIYWQLVNGKQTQSLSTSIMISQMLLRLALLAKESHSVLQEQFYELSFEETDFKQIFRPPLTDYDVIIWLHHHHLPRHHQSVDATKAVNTRHKQQRDSGMPVLDFDPAQCYISELKESFSDVAMFFHDVMGGDLIAVVWKPHAFEKNQFKVVNAQYKIPVAVKPKKAKGDQNLVSPNISAIIEDFEILGRGLVKSVEVVNKSSNESA